MIRKFSLHMKLNCRRTSIGKSKWKLANKIRSLNNNRMKLMIFTNKLRIATEKQKK